MLSFRHTSHLFWHGELSNAASVALVASRIGYECSCTKANTARKCFSNLVRLVHPLASIKLRIPHSSSSPYLKRDTNSCVVVACERPAALGRAAA